MFGLLVFLFTVIPAVEIFLLFKIGGQIGGVNTVFIVIGTGIIGASLAKTQGLSILMKIQDEVNKGALPGNQIIQGLMIFAGGLLLLTPGFVTDLFGLSLVMPGTRHLLMFWVKRLIEKAMKNGNLNFKTFSGHGGTSGGFSYSSTNGSDIFQDHRHEKVDGDIIEAEYSKKE